MFRRYEWSMRLAAYLCSNFALIIAVGLPRCSPSSRTVAPPCPEAAWRTQITPDSILGFCAPPDFVQVKGSRIWTRAPAVSEPPFAGDDWFTLYELSAADAFSETELQPWPPSLLHDLQWQPCIHCLEVTDYAVHWDSVGTHLVRVETGHVTGGFLGEHDKPMLEAEWMVDSARWVVVQAQAASDSGVRTFRRVVQTIRIRW
jgi:hypothetical protein